jgi:hypothetical protein
MAESEPELLLHEWIDDGGEQHVVCLLAGPALRVDQRLLPLPAGGLQAVMERFGRPLEKELAVEGPELSLADGSRVVRFRFRPRFDVIARDYLVYCAPDQEPLCELSAAVAAALEHLAAAAARRAESSSA